MGSEVAIAMRRRIRIHVTAVAICLGVVFQSADGAAETPVERGAYLVNGVAGCGNCHSPKGPDGLPSGPDLIGGPALLAPAFEAYPPNLTPAPETGLGRWTSNEIVMALREGRTPEGAVLRPPMPIAFYRHMSDSDAQAIAAYLKSVPAVENQVPKAHYKGPTPTNYGPPVGSVPVVPRDDKVAYGAYLGELGHCMLCHTPLGANGQRDYENHLGAGGLELDSAGGSVVSANITPDKTTGIGGWTDREIKTALTTGIRPNGAQLAAPMPWNYLKNMNDGDVDAIVAWLRSLKPIAYVAR